MYITCIRTQKTSQYYIQIEKKITHYYTQYQEFMIDQQKIKAVESIC